jgi:hypothetical protein
MKSFADWTDEIRALMNPQTPVSDTCNMVEEWVRAWDLVAGIDKSVHGVRPMTALERGTLVHDAIEKLRKREAYVQGRNLDKSWLQSEWYKQAMKLMALTDFSALEERMMTHGTVMYEVGLTGKGDGPMVVIHDEIRSNEAAFTPNANGWIYLMAPSHAQARAYAQRTQLPKTWRYIHMVDQMYGMRGCKILAVGSWTMNKSYGQVARMEEYMKSHEIEVEYV